MKPAIEKQRVQESTLDEEHIREGRERIIDTCMTLNNLRQHCDIW